MVIDCDADIRSSTSPSSKKFKSSTNRAIAWTSSSLTRSHDFPSQVAPSLYLATQTAISVWIKRRFGDFLVCNGNIFYCLFSSFPSHLRSPLLLLLLWWRLCRLLLLLLLLQRQLKNILMANIIILQEKISNNLASDAAPYSYSCSSSFFPEIYFSSAPDGRGHPGAHLKNI